MRLHAALQRGTAVHLDHQDLLHATFRALEALCGPDTTPLHYQSAARLGVALRRRVGLPGGRFVRPHEASQWTREMAWQLLDTLPALQGPARPGGFPAGRSDPATLP